MSHIFNKKQKQKNNNNYGIFLVKLENMFFLCAILISIHAIPYFLVGIICGPIWGSIAVRDHLRSNLGIICGPGSFAVLGSFADSYSTAEGDSLFGVFIFAKFECRDYRERNELLQKGIAPHASREVFSLVKETRLRRVGRYYSLQLNPKAKSVRSSKAT